MARRRPGDGGTPPASLSFTQLFSGVLELSSAHRFYPSLLSGSAPCLAGRVRRRLLESECLEFEVESSGWTDPAAPSIPEREEPVFAPFATSARPDAKSPDPVAASNDEVELRLSSASAAAAIGGRSGLAFCPPLDVMVYFGRLKGLSKAAAKSWSMEYLERVQLADKANLNLEKLSGGQKQKVQLGVTIMNNPELLILDEPTKGFDPVNRRAPASFWSSMMSISSRPSLLAGEPVDVNGQRGYIEVFLYELLEERRSNHVDTRLTLESVVREYPRADLPLDTSITTKGIRHYGAIMEALQTRLDDFHAQHGMSLLEDFWYRLTADKTVEEVAADIEDEVVQRLSGDTVRYLLAESRDADRPVETPGAFEGWSGYEEPIVWPGPWVRHLDHNALVFWRLRALVMAAENDVRDQVKIPRIGEGLVSEMKLLREIQAAFPGERIVHQARPGWLVPQSLDIYFSAYNIGIEYQGAQHTRPVEFFGGADAFERQQDRDLIKASLCEEYGCALIQVHPGYDLDAVLSKVKDAITAARSKATEHS
ncbi:hypothetical protein ABIE35_001026 [Paenarthrobacter sp. 4246]